MYYLIAIGKKKLERCAESRGARRCISVWVREYIPQPSSHDNFNIELPYPTVHKINKVDLKYRWCVSQLRSHQLEERESERERDDSYVTGWTIDLLNF